MTRDEFISKYWRYYLILEDEFIKTTRYVELNELNFKTYSVEYVKQLQAICAEIDAIFKVICDIDPTKRSNISKYANYILSPESRFKDIIENIINIRYSDISIKPFEGWEISKASKSLKWWNNYNDVKHYRIDNFKFGNLENTIYSLGGLYILEKHLLRYICEKENNEIDIPDKDSELFEIVGWKTRARSSGALYFVEKK